MICFPVYDFFFNNSSIKKREKPLGIELPTRWIQSPIITSDITSDIYNTFGGYQ